MRYCKKCGKAVIQEGFVIDGGLEYYCGEECLHQDYTPTEWEELYTDDGDNYLTEWEFVDLVAYSRLIELKIVDVINALTYLKWGTIEDFLKRYTFDDALHIEKIIKQMGQGE